MKQMFGKFFVIDEPVASGDEIRSILRIEWVLAIVGLIMLIGWILYLILG